jgi:tetratricopeptide (TPR) repeat protein
MKLFKIILILIFWTNLVYSEDKLKIYQKYFTEEFSTDLIKAKDYLFNREYKKAKEIFDKLDKNYPDSPIGIFGLAVIYQSEMLERDNFEFEDEYKKVYKKTIKKIEALKEDGKDNAWTDLILGGMYGLHGLNMARHREWMAAIRYGWLGLKNIENAKARDSDLYEADLGIGLYHYYRSYLTREFNWLPFVEDRRKEGIEEIKRASQKSFLAKEASIITLYFIYFNEKDYNESLKLAKETVKKYNNHMISWIFIGRNYKKLKEYDKAKETFKTILKKDPNSYIAFMHLAHTHQIENKDLDNAIGYYNKALEIAKDNLLWQSYANLGIAEIYLMRDDKEKSEEYFDKAIKDNNKLQEAKNKIIERYKNKDKDLSIEEKEEL